MKKKLISKNINSNFIPLLILIVLLCGIVLRILYMTADPPTDLTISGGILGDPGLYSYSSRNMVLFNRTGFANYEPFSISPFMTYVNYFVYRLFGINFYSHRSIPVLFSILSLILFCTVIYKYLGKYACLFSSIFIAFNYPLLMFSKSANRQFPMLFFFIISIIFFIKGAERKKNILFLLSVLSFALSYLSKGFALYLSPIYFIIAVIWIIEKKIKFKNILTFFLSFTVFMVLWRLFIYLPNKYYLDAIISHNISVGSISSLSKLIGNIMNHPQKIIENILKSPFMLQFKSEPVLLFITLFMFIVYIYYRLSKRTEIPYLVDISVFWILIIIGKNAIFSYRPVRNYLDLIFPASLLAGWFLKKVLDSEIKIKFKFNMALILSLAIVILMLFPFGILKYFKYLRRVFFNNPVFVLFYFIIFLNVLLIILFRQKKIFRVLFLVFILSFSIYSNLSFFNKWAKNRSYQMIHIAEVFGKAIPPSYVAGNWASLLATGTPHKTTLAWPGQINWEPDFLRKNRIQYVMISDFSIDGYRAYKSMFGGELNNATLLAIFKLHEKNLYFFKLEKNVHFNILEIETFFKNKITAAVIYDPDFSNNMGVKFSPIPGETYNLERSFSIKEVGRYEFAVRVKGSFLIDIEIESEDSRILKKTLMIRREKLSVKKFRVDLPQKDNLKIKLIVYRQKTTSFIDYITFTRLPGEQPQI